MSKEQQLFNENWYGKHAINRLLKEEIDSNPDVTQSLILIIEEFKSKEYGYDSKNERIKLIDPEREAISLLTYILKKVPISPIQEATSFIANKMGGDRLSAIKNAADIIAVCRSSKLYRILKAENRDNPFDSAGFLPLIAPNQEVRDLINNREYMLPMVCTPDEWSNNFDGGWLTKKQSCIHGAINPNKHRQALDALNILQSHQFILDKYVLTLEEEPNHELDTLDKYEQWRLLKEASERAYKEIGDTPFHFVWRFDKRGRMYSQGYQINLQSTKYKKALISLANPLTIEGDL